MSSTGGTFNAKESKQVYEVFLNFRGLDTRVGFTDHLYSRLSDANIRTYRDDKGIQKGEEIRSELPQAINESRIAIPIFSKSYAESRWCLMELVEIAKCRRSRGMKVMPIFYNVTPSEVRNQTGSYGEAFKLHDQAYGNTITGEWKKALSEIGELSGWEIPSNTYRMESVLVDAVTKEVSRSLKKAYVAIPHHLVGLDHHVDEILEMLSIDTLGVQIIGIYGMGGIGKTTLATYVYNHLLRQYEGSSFLADTRSKDTESLKKELISNILVRTSANNINMGNGTLIKRFSNKKVLIVLDDVDANTQIEDLIGGQDRHNWFGPGSRIILTTRDEGILRQVRVDRFYELRGMDQAHSLQLLCRHAFQSDSPEAGYAVLCKEIVNTTGGLPLALKVIGSSLSANRCMKAWKIKLDKLKTIPAGDVMKKLKISYDELDERQKHIFLDIACFFIGWDQRYAIHFWDTNFHPEEALGVLQQKSLIKIDENLIWMHDQLRDLGREIDRDGNITEPEKRTRLWNREEATNVLTKETGTEKIQGICVEVNGESYQHFTGEELAKLSKARLFWVKESPHNYFKDFHQRFSNFLPKKRRIFPYLRWLAWHEFPHMYIDTSKFSFGDLTILDLSFSDFTTEWDGWSHIKMARNLKVLDLTGCKNLEGTPEFSSHLQLEWLILEECYNLVKIDKSIGMLQHLVHLNLKRCLSLRELPIELDCMESLTEVLIDGTGIAEGPPWGGRVKLEDFCAEGCNSSKKLPKSIGSFMSLIGLDIPECGMEDTPILIGSLKSLRLLKISDTTLRALHSEIGMVGKLEDINTEDCEDLCCLSILPESLAILTLPSNYMQIFPNLSGLMNLKPVYLSLDDVPSAGVETQNLWWIGRLSKSEELQLEGFEFLKGIPKLLPILAWLVILLSASRLKRQHVT